MNSALFRSRCLRLVACLAGLAVVPGSAGLCSARENGPTRPNVLVISIDDLNDWTGCLGGHPQAKTPNIDRLATQGTLFLNAHCQAPVCTPSRAALVTGLQPFTTGLYFLQPELTGARAARDQPHLMQTLKQAGYRTLGAGKYVHADDESVYFDEYGGAFGGFGPLPDKKLNHPEGLRLWDWGAHPATNEEMPDDRVADWVIGQLQASRDEPFFLVAGFWRPHVPLYAPQAWHDLFLLEKIELPETREDDRDDLSRYAKDLTDGQPAPRHAWFVEHDQWKRAVQSYLASVAFVDHCVGRVLAALAASPHRDDTIVILHSDHGWHLGEKQRWAKRSLWTDGTRIPLIIAAPGFSSDQQTHSPAGLIDLYPTILELTGVEADVELDGQSLVPQLKDPNAVRDVPVICTFGPGNHSLHFARYNYIRYGDGSEELYDLEADPHEWHNLAGEASRQSLLKRFREHLPQSQADIARAEGRSPWELDAWETAEQHAAATNR